MATKKQLAALKKAREARAKNSKPKPKSKVTSKNRVPESMKPMGQRGRGYKMGLIGT